MKTKVIKPKAFNAMAIPQSIQDEAEKIAKEIEKDLKDVTRSWNHKPTFQVDVKATAKSITLEATTDDAVFNYLDKGTKVRHAVMTGNFQAKTKPASGGTTHLTSGRGRGGVAFISRKINRPGIKARGFTKAIQQSVSRGLTARMEKALAKGVKKSNHGTR